MEIDLLICCTVTADMQFPATANIICDKVGARKNAWGFDVNAACSGFLFGLVTGSQFIENGQAQEGGGGGLRQDVAASWTTRTGPRASSSGMAAGAVLLEPE
jgi:3-oxoacyl-[acyl-carrier-protein] synthase-3